MNIQEQIEAARVVAIVRGNFELPLYQAMASALLEGGVRVVEVTMNSAGILDALRLLNQEFGERLLIGAGTVLEPDQIEQAASVGAKFIVAPDTNTDVIRATLDRGLESMPGAFTPTEIMHAHRAGAQLIKLFPGSIGGPDYVKTLRGPLNFIKFVVTGGVDLSNARAFIDAGAVAVGMGSALIRNDFDGSPRAISDLTSRARSLMASLTRDPHLQMA